MTYKTRKIRVLPKGAVLTGWSRNWGGLFRAFFEPLLCFILPLSSFCFLALGPHSPFAALVWILPVVACVAADYFSPADRRERWLCWPGWLLQIRLVSLCLLHWLNFLMLLQFAHRLQALGFDDLTTSAANLVSFRILLGTTACCSGFAVAHELLHQKSKVLRWLGRSMLWPLAYDHFAFEHGLGHHRLASTDDDPATAKFGESYEDFFWRSLQGQWLGAWIRENHRLGDSIGLRLSTWTKHGILQGILIQLILFILVLNYFGGLAFALLLYQAWIGIRMLESVNYVQHWGLRRSTNRFGYRDAWETDRWFSLHLFLGLTRHADHHCQGRLESRQLKCRTESPQLPAGYFVLSFMVRWRNALYINLLRKELQSKGLGPYGAAGRDCDKLLPIIGDVDSNCPEMKPA